MKRSSEFGIRSSELNENVPYIVGADALVGPLPGGPSQLIENVHSTRRGGACPRPRGTVSICRALWRIRGEGRNFFLFACPKRKNQRETTLGRGRLRFLPLPRPTLIETPKRGDPLLDHPRVVRIRPGDLYSPGSTAGRGKPRPCDIRVRSCIIPNSEFRIIRRISSPGGLQAAGRRGAGGSQTSYPAWARRPRCPRPARRSGWRWVRRCGNG